MPRLGDLLVQAGRVSQTQVEDAARSQVAYGGRLGTNLVELNHLDLDELATFLGRQHRLPAAERRHFEQADAALQGQLPAALAGKYGVVPIARVAADDRLIAVATLGPLAPEAVLEIATALSCGPDHLVFAVAAELRILYNLEKVYGIPRSTRFLRTRRGGTQEYAIAPLEPGESSDTELAVPDPVEDQPTAPVDDDGYAVLEVSGYDASVEPEDDATGAERRRFVRTIADDTEPPATEPSGPASLGRINLRKMAIAAAVEGSVTGAGGLGAATTQESLRVIRRCRDREQIGALAIECLARQSSGGIDAAVLFIARGPIAVVWKGFARNAEVAFDQLAVPLDQPSVVAREPGIVIRRVIVDGTPASPLDERLIGALAVDPPTFAIAAPIVIRSHLIGFAYAQGRGDPAEAEALITEVAEATRAALTSLLRAAQR